MRNIVKKRVALMLLIALSVSSMLPLQAQANPLISINVSNLVNGTPPLDDWNYMITEIPTQVVNHFTLPAAGGGSFSMNYSGTSGYSYSISQGNVTTPVEPIQVNMSAVAFYGYNATEDSGHAPYMELRKSKIYLYEDTTTGALSLIMHHNVHLGPTYYIVNMSLQGLPGGASVTLSDDWGQLRLMGGGVALGYWMDGNRTDGGIIGGLESTEWNITAQMLYFEFLGGGEWDYQTASGPILLNWTSPLTITARAHGIGSYIIAQEPKCGYETNIIVNGTVFNGSAVAVENVPPDAKIYVLFNNTIMPEAEGQYTRISTNEPPPTDLGFQIPPNTPVPIQAAWNVDVFNDYSTDGRIDLVNGKPTTILVNLKPTIPVNSQVYVSITIQGIGTYDKTVTSAEYVHNNVISILPSPLIPTTVGPYTIQGYYKVDGGVSQDLIPTKIYVKDTAPLALYYNSLQKSDKTTDYGVEPQTAYNEMSQNTNDFIKATYPVNLATLTSDLAWKTPISGSVPQPKKTDPPEKGMSIDAMTVALNAYNAYGISGKSYVGIGIGPKVTGRPDYFTYHKKPGAAGVSFGPGCKGVIVLDGCWDAAAHEIGHTYGLYWAPQAEEYSMPAYSPNGKTASGVWAQDGTWVTGYDFMGLAHYKKLDLTWVNHDTYESLFKSMLSSPNIDPEILWVSGLIYKNGTVEFPLSWYHYQQGAPDTLTPGDFALRFVASNGTILATTSFDASFFMQVDPGFSVGQNIDLTGFGRVDIDFAPFAFATVYPEETSIVQVLNMTNPQNPLATFNAADIVNVETPVTTEALAGTTGSNGWYVSNVDVTLTAAAVEQIGVREIHYALDGTETVIPGNTATFPISNEGTNSLSYWAVDNAGNIENPNTQIVRIDKTTPTVELTLPQPVLHQAASATWVATDSISGVDGPTSGTIVVDTSSVGPKTVTVTVKDKAGNSITVTKTCNVNYVFGGFREPIDPDGSSIFQLGRTVPVKFQLKDAQGNYVSTAVVRITVAKICNYVVGTEIEAVSTWRACDARVRATEGNLFRYDSTDNQYIFNLSTKSLSVGTWQIKAVLDDGTNKTVIISLRR